MGVVGALGCALTHADHSTRSQVFATVPREGEMPAAVGGLPRWTIAEGVMIPA